MIKISWYKYAIISMIIAAVFGITLGMGTTCLIPVSFICLLYTSETNISRFYNKYIHIVEVINFSKCFRVDFVYKNKSYYFKSKDKRLFYSLLRCTFPVNFKIRGLLLNSMLQLELLFIQVEALQ